MNCQYQKQLNKFSCIVTPRTLTPQCQSHSCRPSSASCMSRSCLTKPWLGSAMFLRSFRRDSDSASFVGTINPFLIRELPVMMSASEGGHGKADVEREVAWILHYISDPNVDKGGGGEKSETSLSPKLFPFVHLPKTVSEHLLVSSS